MKMPRVVAAAVLVLTALFAGSLVTRGQNSGRAADLELDLLDQRVKDFFEKITYDYDDTHAAYQDLLKGSPLLSQTEAMATLEQKTRQLPERYGPPRNFEQVSARRVGKDLVLMKYLYSCQNYPVVWYVTYYRIYKRGDAPRENENWAVVAIRFDTNLDLLTLAD